MSDRNLEYVFNYIGPVLYVKHKTVKYIKDKRKKHMCPNKKCAEYGNDLNICHDNYCVRCGHKIEYLSCDSGERFIDYSSELIDDYVLLTQQHCNGVHAFNENITLAADESVYVPSYGVIENFCGIEAHIELGKYCKNKTCDSFDECVPYRNDYCGECGKKNKNHRDAEIVKTASLFTLKEAKKIMKNYGLSSSLSACNFIDDERFDKLDHDYKASKLCKKSIKSLEKIYGKDSVKVKLAFVQYHENF